jgi:hypothetical protein
MWVLGDIHITLGQDEPGVETPGFYVKVVKLDVKEGHKTVLVEAMLLAPNGRIVIPRWRT